MPWIWNDKTYWKRFKENSKLQLKLLLPMTIISFFLWNSFIDIKDVKLIPLILVSVSSAGIVYTFISIFKEFPNERIPDTYSPFARKMLYIGNFLIAVFAFLYFIKKVILPAIA